LDTFSTPVEKFEIRFSVAFDSAELSVNKFASSNVLTITKAIITAITKAANTHY